jgi:hypothetical protein
MRSKFICSGGMRAVALFFSPRLRIASIFAQYMPKKIDMQKERGAGLSPRHAYSYVWSALRLLLKAFAPALESLCA